MNTSYPQWIDEYAKSMHHSFSRMMPCSWAPDGFAIFKLLQGTFLEKLRLAIAEAKAKGLSIADSAATFPSPSGFRAAVFFAFYENQFLKGERKEETRETLEYLVQVLEYLVHEDTWAYEKNRIGSESEVNAILTSTDWKPGSPEISKELGKLYNSTIALVYSLYGDFFPQDSCDIGGPYDASRTFGDGTIMLDKMFLKLRPTELWPNTREFTYGDIKILQVYRNVSFTCELIGMHSLYTGDLAKGLVSYAVFADGKPVEDIQRLRVYLSEIALEQSKVRDGMSKEDIKNKFIEWLCYQYVGFFKLVGMDWRPTPQMVASVAGKEIPDRLEMDAMPSYEDYVDSKDWEVYWLKQLYK